MQVIMNPMRDENSQTEGREKDLSMPIPISTRREGLLDGPCFSEGTSSLCLCG